MQVSENSSYGVGMLFSIQNWARICISNRVTLKAITQKLPEKDSNTRQNCRG